MSPLLDDEPAMEKMLKYVKRLIAKKSDPTLMTKEEFFRRVEEAEREIAEGKGVKFTNLDDMNQWLETA